MINAAALLLVFCAVGCLAAPQYGCPFDEIMRRNGPPVSVAGVHARKGWGTWKGHTASTSDDWAPLRIVVSSLDLDDKNKYCAEVGSNVLSPVTGEEVVCQDLALFDAAKKATLLNQIVPRAVQLHADRLLVRPVEGSLLVPQFATGFCTRLTVPPAHRDAGVPKADMVLYLAAGPAPWAPIAAIPCALKDDRPIAGVMNFEPLHIDFSRVLVRAAAHELGHALGFDYERMQARKIVEKLENIRGKPSVTVVISAKTKEKAQDHYGCTSILGMELATGEDGKPLSDWDRRNAKDELMSVFADAPSPDTMGFYTSITMALFEDLGVYRANWGMEETMSWGKKAGCQFLTEKCMVNDVTAFPWMFCNSGDMLRCVSDRNAVGVCDIQNNISDLPEYFQYFKDSKKGGSPFQRTDYCPVMQPIPDSCRNGGGDFFPEGLYGSDSWCLDAEAVVKRRNENDEEIGGLCAKVKCAGGKVQVQYKGNDNWHACPEGGSITLTSSSFVRGSIKCPRYAEVCTIADDGSSLVKADTTSSAAVDFLSFKGLPVLLVVTVLMSL